MYKRVAKLSERHVQAIWYDISLRPRILYSRTGLEVQVIDPGIWNLEAGPDFLHATLLVAGETRTGDVEIHLEPRDWIHHNHVTDAAYAHVLAHVTWQVGTIADQLPAQCLEIPLEPLYRKVQFSPDEIDLSAYPYQQLEHTHTPSSPHDSTPTSTEIKDVLSAAGRTRLHEKAQKFAARLTTLDAKHVFAEELLAALGYKYNSATFRALARILPRELPDEPEAIHHVLSYLTEMRILADTPWCRHNVRPVNTPERRIRSAAYLLAIPDVKRRFDAFDLSTRFGRRQTLDLLHEAGIGIRRGAAIIANLLVPLALAEGRLKEVPDVLPPEDLNTVIRRSAHRLLGRDHNPAIYTSNGLLLQGLIHLEKHKMDWPTRR